MINFLCLSLYSAYQEDGDDPESLLFDLTTLRRATDNFAQENKLGHGGFGAVYKVPTIGNLLAWSLDIQASLRKF